MTYNTGTSCANCDCSIVDVRTRVIHSDLVYCCANCAAAMEQQGSGSDPHTLSTAGEARCSHCGSVIRDDTSMVMEGDQVFCCTNCARATEPASGATRAP